MSKLEYGDLSSLRAFMDRSKASDQVQNSSKKSRKPVTESQTTNDPEEEEETMVKETSTTNKPFEEVETLKARMYDSIEDCFILYGMVGLFKLHEVMKSTIESFQTPSPAISKPASRKIDTYPREERRRRQKAVKSYSNLSGSTLEVKPFANPSYYSEKTNEFTKSDNLVKGKSSQRLNKPYIVENRQNTTLEDGKVETYLKDGPKIDLMEKILEEIIPEENSTRDYGSMEEGGSESWNNDLYEKRVGSDRNEEPMNLLNVYLDGYTKDPSLVDPKVVVESESEDAEDELNTETPSPEGNFDQL